MTNLSTLPRYYGLYASCINDNGQVAGWANNPSEYQTACLWTNGGMQDLGTLTGGDYSQAFAINDAGQVAGEYIYDYTQACLWQNGTEQDLDGFSSEALAINSNGQIVGACLGKW